MRAVKMFVWDWSPPPPTPVGGQSFARIHQCARGGWTTDIFALSNGGQFQRSARICSLLTRARTHLEYQVFRIEQDLGQLLSPLLFNISPPAMEI